MKRQPFSACGSDGTAARPDPHGDESLLRRLLRRLFGSRVRSARRPLHAGAEPWPLESEASTDAAVPALESEIARKKVQNFCDEFPGRKRPQ